MTKNDAELLERISAFAHEQCSQHDPAHDVAHVCRVVANARRIACGEAGADVFVVDAAAFLHDIVQLPKGTGEPGESARRSASEASVLLRSLDVPSPAIQAIHHAIEAHSFSGGMKPETLEAAIVQDADRLDAIGAIGIARLWVTAAVMGSKLHHADDPEAQARSLNDRAYGLDHIPVKLRKLPELMNTPTGRKLAVERARYVDEFYARFVDEVHGLR